MISRWIDGHHWEVAEYRTVENVRLLTETARRIHALFIHNIRFTTFVTFFIGAFNPATRTLTYCNAGHNPPIVLHPDGSQKTPLSWLRPTGPAIGLVEAAEFGEHSLILQPEDLLVLYTDGVPEAEGRGGAPWGYDAFADKGKVDEALVVYRAALERYNKR